MHSLEAITKVEDLYSGPQGQPSLGEAFIMLQARWASGARDRETCLRLAFLSWYSCAEPNGYTGLPNDQELTSEIFANALAALGGELSSDPEVCYTLGLMAKMFPWAICAKNQTHWRHVGQRLTLRAEAIAPQGLTPSEFVSRGAYGQYFSHQSPNLKAGS
ncbi:hypothetical protein [Rhodanobacter sp. L36]|uniref:hypothetical protein n=1 Tax=Rhodanobacter sp. L36 TaxID=1747221 RepID=UPI00131B34E2|nr:hypothetical protein [Rhodanobacter sp. L36]